MSDLSKGNFGDNLRAKVKRVGLRKIGRKKLEEKKYQTTLSRSFAAKWSKEIER